jgi:hypothetical protein
VIGGTLEHRVHRRRDMSSARLPALLASIAFVSLLPACEAVFERDDPADLVDVAAATKDSTAMRVYLSVESDADLLEDYHQDARFAVRDELDLVADALMQEGALENFYTPLPWEPGKITIKVKGQLRADLAAKMNGAKTLDLYDPRVGGIDFLRLVADNDATQLVLQRESDIDTSYVLSYDGEQNPKRVAAAFQALDDVWYASAHYVDASPRFGIEWTSQFTPSVYVFEVGWGEDCFGGCPHRNRTYVEVKGEDYATPSATKIGATGEPLPSDMQIWR